jgi:oligoribonuclease
MRQEGSEVTIIWCDMETTGLDHRRDPILEVALIATTSSLTTIAERTWLHVPPDWDRIRSDLHPAVDEMHTANGLLADIDALHEKGGEPYLFGIEDQIMAWIGSVQAGRGKATIGGSGVASFDIQVIRQQMPRLAQRLNYWSYDIGSVRRVGLLAGIAAPSEMSDGAVKTHRALDDVRMHLAEARWWLDLLTRVRHSGLRGLDTTEWTDMDEVAQAVEVVATAYQAGLDGAAPGWYPADDFARWFDEHRPPS